MQIDGKVIGFLRPVGFALRLVLSMVFADIFSVLDRYEIDDYIVGAL